MTVLLIDGVGRRREMDVRELVSVIAVPIPRPLTWMYWASGEISYQPPPIAIFKLSDELSLPPVYRFAGLHA
jgi:hypothetical protein